jgi:hypothetical protein
MSRLLLTALLAMATAPMQTPSTTQTAAPAGAATSSPAASKQVPASVPQKQPVKAVVNPSDAVITIHGLCNSPASAKASAGSAGCNTVVTRQEFDGVVDGLNALGRPLLSIQLRGIAEGYANTVVNYEKARKAGVERDPRFAEVMRLARMRAMGDMYNALQVEKARKVSPEEIKAYYTKNIEKFEELSTHRVALPKLNLANLKDQEYTEKARKVANDIHARMVKGEDLDKLEKEAYETLGVKNPPTTKMGVVRRGVFVDDQEKQLFAMKPGDISGVIELPSAFIIFKLDNRETPSLEKSKEEIVRILIKEHMDKQEAAGNKAVQVEFNEQYVGPAQASAWMPASQLNANDGHGGSDPKAPHKDEPQK